MEDTDGELHPAVDGQSLDEDEDEDFGKFSMCTFLSSGPLLSQRFTQMILIFTERWQ